MRTYFFVVMYSLTKICQNLQCLISVNFATAIPLACPLDLKINPAYHIMVYCKPKPKIVKDSLIFLFQTKASALRLAKFANLRIIVGVPVPLRLS